MKRTTTHQTSKTDVQDRVVANKWSISDTVEIPECQCGGEVVRKTANSEKNPGRNYFKCTQCESFTWEDSWMTGPKGKLKIKTAARDTNNDNNVKLDLILSKLDSILLYLKQ